MEADRTYPVACSAQSHTTLVRRRRRRPASRCTWRLGSAAACSARTSTPLRRGRVTCQSHLLLKYSTVSPSTPADTTSFYSKGFAVTCALQFLAALAAIVLTVSYRIENRRRDRKYGKPVPNARVDTTELADKVCSLRILLRVTPLSCGDCMCGCGYGIGLLTDDWFCAGSGFPLCGLEFCVKCLSRVFLL